MEWEEKIEMVKLLNNGKYKEATDYYLSHESWSPWDDVQALSMYVNGIDLTKATDCVAFENKLKKLQANQNGDLGFPDDYTLIGTQSEQKKFIGNAVEVNMSRVLCEALVRKLESIDI